MYSVHCLTKAKHGLRDICTLRDERDDTKINTLHVNDTYEVWAMSVWTVERGWAVLRFWVDFPEE